MKNRIWGKFYNLFIDDNVKVKELILNPGKGISFQNTYSEVRSGLFHKANAK